MYSSIFVAAFAVQVAYWILLARGFSRAAKSAAAGADPAHTDLPVSVVVAARNEVERLPELLASLRNQSHRAFEVVVADDGSDDGTAELLARESGRWSRESGPQLRHLRVQEGEAEQHGLPRKKYALSLAIGEARSDRLVITDADCRPEEDWLSTMARWSAPAGEDDGAVLIGFGPYLRRRGLLNAFVRYETFLSGFGAAAALGWRRPFMAVGRNFSYSKALFERIGGFAHSADSLSGDDDLLVQEVARTNAAPVRFVMEPASYVWSEAPDSISRWLGQKLRHTSAGRFYSRSAQFHLLLFHASNLLVWLGAPIMKIFFGSWLGVGLLAGRFLVQRAALRPAAEQLEARDLSLAQPFLDLLYLLYNSLVAPVGAILKRKRW